ncbi:MAG: ATP-binding protein [Anaeromyxobacteraceae bacterium]
MPGVRPPPLARSIVRVGGALGAVIGGAYLVLWLLGIPPRWAARGIVTTKTNMALAQLLAGASLLLLRGGRRTPARRLVAVAASSLVLLIGALTLFELASGVDLGIDQLIATEPAEALQTMGRNRMGPLGAVGLTLLGVGLLALAWRRRVSVWFGAALSCLVLVPTVGFFYGITALYRSTQAMIIAWPTVVALLALGLGLAFADAEDGTVPVLWRDDAGGVLLRRMLLPVALLPIVIGFFGVAGERRGLYSRLVGTGMFAVSLSVLSVVLVWRTALRLSTFAAQRARAEEEARERARLLELTHDAIFTWSRTRGIESWNHGAAELYGYTESEAVGRAPEDLLGTQFPSDWSAIEAELERSGRWEGEVVHHTRAGAEVTVSAKLQVVRGSDGQRHVLESNRNVSDAKRAAERLRLMLDANPIGVLLKRGDGLVVDANDAYLRIVGATREELVLGGVSSRDFTPPEHVALDDAAVAEAHQRGISSLYEKEYLRRDGERVPVLVASASIGGGEYVSFVLDITERKRADEAVRAANEQLRAADRRKNEFLGMLSHELRNPLAPIRNSVYLLQRGAAGDEQGTHAMEVIRRQTEHLTRLVDDLLDVTRIASGKIELRLADVDLAELAARTADDHRAVMKHRDLALDVHAPRAPVFVRGDRTRLAQIVGNLLQNAAKFTNAGGRVTLSVAAGADGMAELSVRDTGIGIEPALLDHLFEPFTQAAQTLARSEGGLGLGLALVKGLAELHGGAVTATSDGMQQGSAFTVRLPLHAPRPWPVPGAVDDAPRPRQQYRVLVVDDNEDAAESLAELVKLFGHEVEIAYDGPSAVEKARAYAPDVVLCDIGLPGMDGYEVAKALRASHASDGARLVAVSGYAGAEDIRRAKESGFDAHVAKPADPERIEQLLH